MRKIIACAPEPRRTSKESLFPKGDLTVGQFTVMAAFTDLTRKCRSGRIPSRDFGNYLHEAIPGLRLLHRKTHFGKALTTASHPFNAICTPMHNRTNATTRRIPWIVAGAIFSVILEAYK